MHAARVKYGQHVQHLTRVNATVVYELDRPAVHEKPWRHDRDDQMRELELWRSELLGGDSDGVDAAKHSPLDSLGKLHDFINGAHRGLTPSLLYHYQDGLDSVCGRVMEHGECWRGLQPDADVCRSEDYVDPVFGPKPCEPDGTFFGGRLESRCI